ncbi:hypothetical protein C492_17498, partial [Natronococcus jeotgali DSM 18795]
MSPEFTDDDIGKTVINADGEEVGLVADVEHGTAHVEPDPGITDTIKAKLGWGDTDEDSYPLQEPAVAEVTGDEIHLERDLESGSGAAGAGTTAGAEAATGATDTADRGSGGLGDDDDEFIGDDNDDDLIGDDSNDDDLIGDDNDDDLIGDDNDDDLIG